MNVSRGLSAIKLGIRSKPILNIPTRSLFIKTSLINSNNINAMIVKRTLITEKNEHDLLISQRGKRPISPHLTIYQPQITWYMSSVHRITCCLIGFSFYILIMLLGISSIFNLNINSNTIKNYYDEKISKNMKLFIKGTFAYMFAFQIGGTLRHLTWDFGKALTLKGVYKGGYTVLAFGSLFGTYLWLW